LATGAGPPTPLTGSSRVPPAAPRLNVRPYPAGAPRRSVGDPPSDREACAASCVERLGRSRISVLASRRPMPDARFGAGADQEWRLSLVTTAGPSTDARSKERLTQTAEQQVLGVSILAGGVVLHKAEPLVRRPAARFMPAGPLPLRAQPDGRLRGAAPRVCPLLEHTRSVVFRSPAWKSRSRPCHVQREPRREEMALQGRRSRPACGG